MSILDKASLIQIPSGYKSGKLYSIKPDNGDGDFTFSRSSSATRVNSEGLIETASVLGSELITNGNFENWTADNPDSWTVLNEDANNYVTQDGSYARIVSNDTASIQIKQTIFTIGKLYKVELDAIVNSGNVEGLKLNDATAPATIGYVNSTGRHTFYFIAANTAFVINRKGGGDTDISIDNVSVKEVIENDVPRLDYSGGASCASLLLEGQSTNEITYSEIFTESGYGWNYSANALEVAESNSIISPDGTQNADKIAKTAVRVYAYAYKTATLVSAQNYSWSMFMKKGTHDIGYLALTQGDTEFKAYYDLTNGTSGMLSGSATHKIEDYGNGWFRCSLQDISSTTDLYVRFNFGMAYSTSSENWPSSSGGDGLYAYFWGAQLEQGNLTSYIPTTSATVTRTADVCDNAGTSATFNSTEGVLFAEIAALADDTQQQIGVYGDSTTEQLRIEITNNVIKGQLYNGAFQANMSSTQTVTNFNKVALKWKVDDFALWINGTEVATDSSGTTFSAETLDRVHFSAQNGSTYAAQAKTKQLMVFDEALSNEELSDLTGQINTSFVQLADFYNYTIL